MKVTSIHQPIQRFDGEITTLAAIGAHSLEFRMCKFHAPRSKKGWRIAFFADYAGTRTGWEISQSLYLRLTDRHAEVAAFKAYANRQSA